MVCIAGRCRGRRSWLRTYCWQCLLGDAASSLSIDWAASASKAFQANAFDLGSAHFTMGGMLNGASGGPPTTGDPCRCLGGFGSGGGQAGLPASVAQSGAGSSLGTKGIDWEAAAADAGGTAISPGAASNTNNIATVAMPDDFVLQRIPSLLSARNLGLTRLTPNRRTHREV